jgi:hypothetical protein
MRSVTVLSTLVSLGLAVMLISITATAGSMGEKNSCVVWKYVENEDVDLDFSVVFPTLEELYDFYEELPTEVQTMILQALESQDPETILGILDMIDRIDLSIDGKLHADIHVWEREETYDADIHIHWKGVISISFMATINEDLVEIFGLELDIKNFQLILHLKDVQVEPLNPEELMLNMILRGSATVNILCDSDYFAMELDLWSHLLLKIDDGGIQMLKIWLPSWFGAFLT